MFILESYIVSSKISNISEILYSPFYLWSPICSPKRSQISKHSMVGMNTLSLSLRHYHYAACTISTQISWPTYRSWNLGCEHKSEPENSTRSSATEAVRGHPNDVKMSGAYCSPSMWGSSSKWGQRTNSCDLFEHLPVLLWIIRVYDIPLAEKCASWEQKHTGNDQWQNWDLGSGESRSLWMRGISNGNKGLLM